MLSLSVLFLLLLSSVFLTFLTRRVMYRILVEQVLEDNRVIGEQILDILQLLEYEDLAEDKLKDYLQRFCDEVMLPNEGYMCVADPEGRLVALPGLQPGEEQFIDRAELREFRGDNGEMKGPDAQQITELEYGEIFEGFLRNPEANADDIIVSMPLGDTGLRMLVHQSREGVRNRAGEIIKPFLFMQLGFSLLVSFFIFVVVNSQVKRYEGRLEKLNTQLVEKNNQRKQLIHMLSHDLTNPIGAIKSACDFIYEEQDLSLLREYHKVLTDSINRSLAIIGLVRKIEALESGKMQLELTPVNVKRSVESVIQMLGSKYAEKQISFALHISPELSVRAEANSFENTVLANILSNAVKFSQPSSTIEISASEEGDIVRIQIRDHGVGIPADLQEKLFDVSAQTSRPGTAGETGTGFGMPLVKSFVRYFGGEIHIASKTADEDLDNRGTMFTLLLEKV